MYLNPIYDPGCHAENCIFSGVIWFVFFFITFKRFEYPNYADKNTVCLQLMIQISFNFQFLLNVPALEAIGLAFAAATS